MVFAKLSMVMLCKRIAPAANGSAKFAIIMCAAWGIFSFFATAFQCQLPKPWVFVPSQCNTHGYLQLPVIVLNVVTDAILGSGHIAYHLETEHAKGYEGDCYDFVRSQVIVSQAPHMMPVRINVFCSVPVLTLGELVSVTGSRGSLDQPWASLTRVIWLM
jgi:hypothetical protein